jgi:hypothetical protein
LDGEVRSTEQNLIHSGHDAERIARRRPEVIGNRREDRNETVEEQEEGGGFHGIVPCDGTMSLFGDKSTTYVTVR